MSRSVRPLYSTGRISPDAVVFILSRALVFHLDTLGSFKPEVNHKSGLGKPFFGLP